MNLGKFINDTDYVPLFTGGIYVKSYKRGKHTYGDPTVMNYMAPSTLTIGDYCSIADGVEILLGGEHHIDWVSTFPFNPVMRLPGLKGYPHTHGNVVIGNDVFIGRNAMILSGVTIGDGAVIGAGAVVTHNVEPYAITTGNRAKTIGYRFNKSQIDALLKIKWWDWSEDKVISYAPLLQNSNIDKFIEEASNVL
jgi:acetyltransferase-like isoleucine patch superfamily enzyme